MDHYIICGFGRIGHLICRDFQSRPLISVVVEKAPQLIDRGGYMYVEGNATDDETLLAAGIDVAKSLINLGEQPAIKKLEKLAAGHQP